MAGPTNELLSTETGADQTLRPADLLISEYVEGSSNNKAIEIFNGTGAPIDLAEAGYVLQYYFNGSRSPGLTITLTGVVAPGEVFVVAQSAAAAAIRAQADQTNGSGWFNGDDAVVLKKGGAGGGVIDSVGQVGADPGSQWGSGLNSTADNTLRLKAGVITGDTDITDAYDPSARYEGFANDTFNGLGSHGSIQGTIVTVKASDPEATEGSTDVGLTFTFTRDGDLSQALTVSYTRGGSATAGADYSGEATGQITFAAGQATAELTFSALDDTEAESTETVEIVLVDGPAYDLGEARSAAAGIVSDEVAVTRISQIQGAGSASALVGRTVTVEAVVVGDFQNGDADADRNLGGFFIQEEDRDGDGDASTSEGLFVFEGLSASTTGLAEGTRVRVTGVVSEQFGLTQLQNVTVTVVEGDGSGEVTAAVLDLPNANLEAFEGMLVTVPETLVVTDQTRLEQYGEISLYAPEGDGLGGAIDEAADGRPFQFTQTNDPATGATVAAYNAAIDSRTIIYDDGLNGTWNTIRNPDGGGLYTTANALQNGDSITGLTGVLDYGFDAFRLRSIENGQNDFTNGNPREPEPADVGGSLKVASLNVLNFFVTLDQGDNVVDGTDQSPRGAQTREEFDRQVGKLVDTLITIDADVLALIEIENDFSAPVNGDFIAAGNAIGYLVQQLNARLGGDVYSYVHPGQDRLGGDAIALGFIYKNDVVGVAEGTLVAVDYDPVNHRPTVAVTFEELATGGEFTAVANHFKSKRSGTDAGDGQGRSNDVRTDQAQRLAEWLEANPTKTTDTDYLLLGDFNAYYREDPIDVLRGEGFQTLGSETDYSYTFDGQIGSLDHALANGALAAQVTGVTKWHVNSDEAEGLDYNLDGARSRAIFDADAPYRVSDHDPIIVGLNLRAPPKAADASVTVAEDETLTGAVSAKDPNGDPLTYALAAGPKNGVLTFKADGTYTYTPGADFNGSDSFAFKASDGSFSDDGVVTITVTPVNDAPTGSADSASAREDAVVAIDVLANDVDKDRDAMSIVLSGDKSELGASIRVENGRLVYSADADAFDRLEAGQTLVDTVTYRVSDGNGGFSDPITVSVTVTEAGDNRTLSGSNKGEVFVDAPGFDTVWLGGNGQDEARGGDGADELHGGNGKDVLFGDAGSDILVGGAGSDELWGGAGADTFVFAVNSGRDTIMDFDAREDRIVLGGGAGLRFENLDSDNDGRSDSVELHSPGGGSTVLSGLSIETLIEQGCLTTDLQVVGGWVI